MSELADPGDVKTGVWSLTSLVLQALLPPHILHDLRPDPRFGIIVLAYHPRGGARQVDEGQVTRHDRFGHRGTHCA